MMAMALQNVTSFKALFRPAALPNRTRFKALGRTRPPSAGHQGWHFSRQKVVYAICRFKPVFTGKKWQKLAKTQNHFPLLLQFLFQMFKFAFTMYMYCNQPIRKSKELRSVARN